MATLDDIKRLTRDHNRYTGDGLPGAPVNAPLPVGDPSSGHFNPSKSDIRELLTLVLQALGNPQALDALKAEINGNIISRDFRSTRVFTSRSEANDTLTAGLPVPAHVVFGIEEGDLVVRYRSATEDPLFPEAGAQGRWGILVNLSGLANRANHTGKQAIETITGLVDALADKAPASASFTDPERTKLGGIEAGAQKNTVAKVAGKTGDVTLAKADVGLSSVDNTPDTEKPVSAAQKAALDAKASVIDLDRKGLAQTERPGEDKSRWSTVTNGAPEARPPLALGVVVDGVEGAALRVRGQDVPASEGYLDVAPRRAYAVDPGRIYRVRMAFARAVDSVDPSGDTIEVRFRNLNASKGHASNVLRSQHAPKVADGLVEVSFTLSRTAGPGVDYVTPPTGRYVVPFLRIFGVGQETDIVHLIWDDITDRLAGGADVSALQTRVGTVEADLTTKADAEIVQAALGRIERTSLSPIERPGEDPLRWSSDLAGEPDTRPPLAVGEVVSTDRGAVLRVGGADIPAPGYLDAGPRQAYALEAGRIYRLRAGFARAVNSPDPARDVIELRVKNLKSDKGDGINAVVGGPYPLRVADGFMEVGVTISRSAAEGVEYVANAEARYITPSLRIYGADQKTDIAYMHWDDITEVMNKADKTDLVGKADLVALEGEVRIREGLISRTDATGTTLQDASGFVFARFTPDEWSAMGRFRLGDFDGTDFVIRDPSGFAMFRAGLEGLFHMGVPVGQPSTPQLVEKAPDVELARTGVRLPAVRSLPKWRYARAGAVQRQRHARIACIGDSNTMGWDALGEGLHRRSLSYPSAVAQLLSEFGATAENYFGRAVSASGYTAYDPRITVGSGWAASGPASLGGETWINSTTDAAIRFAPVVPWDTAEVYVAVDAEATLSIGIGADVRSVVVAAGSVLRLTQKAVTVGLHALELRRVAGALRIIGWDCFDSLRAGVSLLNMGKGGWRSNHYADASAFYSPRNAIAALGADLHLIQLGLNDWKQERPPADFRADMQTIITACQAQGDVALIVPFTPGETHTSAWEDFVHVIHDLGRSNGLPVVDLGLRLGPTHADAVAGGWVSNLMHPNAYGYGETAMALSQLLRK